MSKPSFVMISPIFAFGTVVSTLESEFTKVFLCDTMEKWNADVLRYNEANSKMLSERGIVINDLCSLMLEDLDKYICEDGVHATELGYDVLAHKVACAIKELL